MSENHVLAVVSRSVSETERIGGLIGTCLQPGMTIALNGTLGAGKTNLVQAIAESLSIDRKTVVSPTFTMIQLYQGKHALVHIDAYRIADEDEFFELGIAEYFEDDSIVAIEWAGKFSELLPENRIEIEIQVLDETSRRLQFSWSSTAQIANEVGQALAALFPCD